VSPSWKRRTARRLSRVRRSASRGNPIGVSLCASLQATGATEQRRPGRLARWFKRVSKRHTMQPPTAEEGHKRAARHQSNGENESAARISATKVRRHRMPNRRDCTPGCERRETEQSRPNPGRGLYALTAFETNPGSLPFLFRLE
jgi:hypothetical protein